MRFVITGGTGHIGNNVIRYIKACDEQSEVIALVRKVGNIALDGVDCTQVACDFSKELLKANIQEGDIVVHLAGVIDLKNNKKDETERINFQLTKDICDVCQEKKVAKFVYVGSVDAIYKEGDEIISEPERYFPEKVKGNYAQSKAKASGYVLEAINSNPHLNYAIVLPSAVIGINDFKPSAVGKIISDCINGKSELGIKGGYNFVDVEDVAKGIYKIATSNLRGQYILSGHNVTVKELYEKINKIKNLKKKPIIIPTWIATLACPFVNVLNKITLKALQEPHNYLFLRAQKDFGYSPKDFEQTLKRTLDWFASKK
ncbi:MAG: NAD-dependent epimerase/dehydratase family protein [Clostridia bacterium]|nr:NAD-dependent epimerase/dehydratase family protein [Clostridia bacterium]